MEHLHEATSILERDWLGGPAWAWLDQNLTVAIMLSCKQEGLVSCFRLGQVAL